MAMQYKFISPDLWSITRNCGNLIDIELWGKSDYLIHKGEIYTYGNLFLKKEVLFKLN